MRKVALLLLVAPLALAACGSSSSSTPLKVDPVSYVKHAAHTTGDTSEHLAMTATVTGAGQSITFSGSGDFSSNPTKGAFAVALNLPGHTAKVNEVIDGTTLYISGQGPSQLGDGKKWVEIDLAKLGARAHVDFASLITRSPTEAIQQLEAAGSVSQMGDETIDGVATRHFRVTNLDVSKLPQGGPLMALGSVPTFGPIDVWIGKADGYVYRETASLTFSAAGQSATMTSTVDLSKFGEKVDVTIPPASQVIQKRSQAATTSTTIRGHRQ